VTHILQCKIAQMHIDYNLILHSIFYIFRALKTHHQEDTCKNTGNVLYVHVVYGESVICEYTGIKIGVIIGHIKSKYIYLHHIRGCIYRNAYIFTTIFLMMGLEVSK